MRRILRKGDNLNITLPLKDLVEAHFLQRFNRFIISCEIVNGEQKGNIVEAHLADPGRLRELLLPGCRLWLAPTPNPQRKTKWSAVLVESTENTLVSLVSSLPNSLIKQALTNKAIPDLAAWDLVRSEYPVNEHRFDFLLQRGNDRMLLEVKSVTLVENHIGLFPDAVTVRGRKHLETLARLTQAGTYQSAVLFVVQRNDAIAVSAATHIDPLFAQAWISARQNGVMFLSHRCKITTKEIQLGDPLPIIDPSWDLTKPT